MEHGLILAAILFVLGLIGVLVRRNIVFMLMSVEIMLNAVGVAFVVAGARWGQVDGQVMFIYLRWPQPKSLSGLRSCFSFITTLKQWTPM